MKKVIVIILVFLSILMLTIRFGTKPLFKALGIHPKAGLRVEASQKATVYLNDKQISSTPFQNEDLAEGDYLLRLEADPENQATDSTKLTWQGYVTLNSGTLTVVNRELSVRPTAMSGEVITLDKGEGVTIISHPSEAEVLIDGKVMGRTPLRLNDIALGEHQFIISKDNYLKRSVRASVVGNFNLILTVDLALSEADLTKLSVTPITTTPMVQIKNTPTGYLRVRLKPSANSTEVTRLKPGENVPLLEELSGWYRVRLSTGEEGYIATAYAEKK